MKPGTLSRCLSRDIQTCSKAASEPLATRKRFIAIYITRSPALGGQPLTRLRSADRGIQAPAKDTTISSAATGIVARLPTIVIDRCQRNLGIPIRNPRGPGFSSARIDAALPVAGLEAGKVR